MGRDARLRAAGVIQKPDVAPEPPQPERQVITGSRVASILRLASMMAAGRPVKDPLPLTLSPLLRARMKEAQRTKTPLTVSQAELERLQEAGIIPK